MKEMCWHYWRRNERLEDLDSLLCDEMGTSAVKRKNLCSQSLFVGCSVRDLESPLRLATRPSELEHRRPY